jgi:hypothetical protein
VTQPNASEAAVAAIRIFEAAQRQLSAIPLSNGIVLKIKPVAKRALAAVTDALVEPTPPEFEDPSSGRMLPNALDPDFNLALEKYEHDVMEAAFSVMLALGTEVESVPDGVAGPDSDDWVDMLSTIGVEPRLEGHGRYLDWLEFIALTEPSDLAVVQAAVTIRTGVTEGRVAGAIAYFRDYQTRRAVAPGAPAEGNSDRDRVPEAKPAPRRRVRGTRSGSV